MLKAIIFLFFTNFYLFAEDITDIYKRCIICHGDKGQNQALGRSILISKLSKEEFITALTLYKEGNKNESGLGGVMQAQVYFLTEEDFEKLADIFYSMNHPK